MILDTLYGKVYVDNAQLGLLPLQIEVHVTVVLILIINQYKIFVKENVLSTKIGLTIDAYAKMVG